MVLLACKNKSTYTIPVSEYAASWIPANQDSVLFKTIGSRDSFYLNYEGYARENLTLNEITLQQIAQQAYSTDSGFVLNYLLQSGFPAQDSLGRAEKTDYLRLSSLAGLRKIDIGNQVITTDLFVVDTVKLPNNETYSNVLTDSVAYFFTRNDGIIMYKNGATWFFKVD